MFFVHLVHAYTGINARLDRNDYQFYTVQHYYCGIAALLLFTCAYTVVARIGFSSVFERPNIIIYKRGVVHTTRAGGDTRDTIHVYAGTCKCSRLTLVPRAQ